MKTIALVGGPNTGKSTFFNTALNAGEHTGNWHGVTVDAKEREFKQNGKVVASLVDLPGTYSLTSFSLEEEVTRNYLYTHSDLTVLNILDGNALQKNLILTLELIEMGLSPIVCINMANELKTQIDIYSLEKLLKTKVFLINAQKKSDVLNVLGYCLTSNNKVIRLPYFDDLLNKFETVSHKTITFESNFVKNNSIKNFDIYSKIKLLECDEYFCNNIDGEFKSDSGTLNYVFKKRFDFLSKIYKSTSKKIYGYNNADKFILNKWLALPIFLLIISSIFYLTFGKVGGILTDLFSNFLSNYIFEPFVLLLSKFTQNQFVVAFFCDAVCGAIGSILSFLPQIVLMYLGLYILEDSGYMSRLAFIFDDHMQKVGLSGKSIFTLLMCFGCSTTGALTSRNQNDKNTKIKTALLTPYLSCSAKLPIYSVVLGAFFPRHKFLFVIGFYLLGIIASIAICKMLNKTYLKSFNNDFILEMPPYRFPSIKKITKNVFVNIKEFLIRAGSVLLVFSCIVWLLQNFKINGVSILEFIANIISPLFKPIGLNSPSIVLALLCGVVAKEMIVSTIGIINNLGSESTIQNISQSLLISSSAFCLSPASALSFLTFATLYLPCISTFAVLKKEIGTKWASIGTIIQLFVSYILSFVVFRISSYFLINGFWSGIISLICFIGIVAVILIFRNLVLKHKFCKFCPKQKSCHK